MQGYLTDNVKFVKVKDHSAAGTSAITSDAIDTQGYDGCVILTSFSVAAANNILKAQQSSDNDADSYADLVGTGVTSGASPSNEDVWVDIKCPRERYLKGVATPGTSSTVESIWAILYNARSLPVDNTTDGTITGEQHLSPAEGTA